MIDGHGPRRLGQTVALEQVNACRVEEARDLGRERSAAADAKAQASAETVTNLLEDQAVVDGVFGPLQKVGFLSLFERAAVRAGEGDHACSEGLERGRARIEFSERRSIDFFVDARNRDQNRRTHFDQVFDHSLEAFGIGVGPASAQREHLLAASQDVGQRQEEQSRVVFAKAQHGRYGRNKGQERLVRQFGALGNAAGA